MEDAAESSTSIYALFNAPVLRGRLEPVLLAAIEVMHEPWRWSYCQQPRLMR